jgi:NTE family protein
MIARANNLRLDEGVREFIPDDAMPAEPTMPSAAPMLRKPRVGLALSCGGAKGLAHIGVIQVLEENGIEVDAIAGSSMGAYIAAIWGFGHDGKKMEALAREYEGRFGLRRLLDPVFPPRQGFIRGERMKRRLQRTIGELQFSDMVRKAMIIATELNSLEKVVFTSGEVASAVHASVAIPGVCVPVQIGGRAYIDGGIADPLPVDVLKEAGMDRVIAVNTIPPPSFLKCCEEQMREQAVLRGEKAGLFGFLNRHVNYFAPGNILDIMMRAVHGSQVRVAESACRRADLVLRPLAIEGSWIEFNHPQKYIELGRRVARENLGAIKAVLSARIPSYEHQPTRRAVGTVV